MNNTVKDFWTELDNRISSPLFASFLISWLICNWRIPVALIFIKQDELGPGYYSYFDLIEKQATLVSFTWPAIIAVIYTFGYPYLKEIITLYLSEKEISINEKLYIQADQKTVPAIKYLNQKRELKKYEIELAELVNNEKTTQFELDKAKLTIKELEVQNDLNLVEFERKAQQQKLDFQTNSLETEQEYQSKIREIQQLHDSEVSREIINLQASNELLAHDYNNMQRDHEEQYSIIIYAKDELEHKVAALTNLIEKKDEEIEYNKQMQFQSGEKFKILRSAIITLFKIESAVINNPTIIHTTIHSMFDEIRDKLNNDLPDFL